MLNILDLSNEIVYRIIEDVPVFDVPALAFSNKSFYALTQSPLKQYLALKKRYSVLEFGDVGGGDQHHRLKDTGNAILFLGTVIAKPEIALYPTAMHVRQCDYRGSREEEHFIITDHTIARHKSKLRSMIKACDFLSWGNGNLYKDICYDRDETSAAGLLLTLLPNLTSVNVKARKGTSNFDWITPIVHGIQDANRFHPRPRHRNRALCRLRNVACIDSEQFRHFALLPSICSVQTAMHISTFQWWPSSLTHQYANVTEIDIHQGSVSPAALEGILFGVQVLRKFKYSYCQGWDIITRHPILYTPGGIIAVLAKYAAKSLRSLAIESNYHPRNEQLPPMQGVGSLRMFTSLEFVRMEDLAFAQTEKAARIEIRAGGSCFAQLPTYERLVDLLPASLEKVCLVQKTQGYDRATRELLRGMAEEKAEKLPALKHIDFEHARNPLGPSMQAALQEAGVSLKFWGIQELWAWSKEFDD